MHVSDLSFREISPPDWDAFITASPQGSLYATHAFASAVAEGWRALVVTEAGTWKAVLPYFPRKKWGLPYALQPAFCQTWGPMLAPESREKSTYEHFREQQASLEALAAAFPTLAYVYMQCHSSMNYLLPFQQQGFVAGLRYTHLLSLDKPGDLHQGLSSQARRKLRKSEKSNHSIRFSEKPDSLFRIARANQTAGHDIWGGLKNAEAQLERLVRMEEAPVRIFDILTPDGEAVASGLFGFWNRRAYYLAGGQLPQANKEGGMYRLIWEAMTEASRQGCHTFDFEGSMIPGVARFFRQFGSTPTPYFSLTKNRLPLWLRWMRV